MNVLRTITTNALCAFGMTFVILTGGIDLSVGSFMSLAGCLTTVLVAWFQVPAVLAVLLSLSAGTLFGAMNGFIITKMKMPPFYRYIGYNEYYPRYFVHHYRRTAGFDFG